jgi:histidinol-phosphatase (PHP family)
MEFLELARAAGVPLVISSDAHAPSEIGRDFSRAIEIARSAGYDELATFVGGKRNIEKIHKSAP